jgi:predicted nuclease with RNAse H fold
MITAGIDLAAEPKGTALAIIDFQDTSAKLVQLQLGLDDKALIEQTVNADKIGIDCAFGWPVEFVEFLNQHMVQDTDQPIDQQKDQDKPTTNIDGAMEWRRTLAYRETDRQVRKEIGRWPLSVSTDRLGLTAMRNAGLLARLKEAGVNTKRDGTGTTIEVYPGATLRLWSFDTTNYRVSQDQRRALISQLERQAPWLELGEYADLMYASCDAFDAVIAALAARAVALNKYIKPTATQLEKARVEGWICLPSCGLGDLGTG